MTDFILDLKTLDELIEHYSCSLTEYERIEVRFDKPITSQ